MKRVAIIGNGGAGKSTLALALAKSIEIPVYHLDQFIWKAEWNAISEIDFTYLHT